MEQKKKDQKNPKVHLCNMPLFIYLIYGYGPLFHIYLLSSVQSFNVQSSSLLME